MVADPIMINEGKPLGAAISLMKKYNISGIPVIDSTDKLVGIITNRDIRFIEDQNIIIKDIMTRNIVTVNSNISDKDAKDLLHKHRIEKLLVTDKRGGV